MLGTAAVRDYVRESVAYVRRSWTRAAFEAMRACSIRVNDFMRFECVLIACVHRRAARNAHAWCEHALSLHDVRAIRRGCYCFESPREITATYRRKNENMVCYINLVKYSSRDAAGCGVVADITNRGVVPMTEQASQGMPCTLILWNTCSNPS